MKSRSRGCKCDCFYGSELGDICTCECNCVTHRYTVLDKEGERKRIMRELFIRRRK